MFQSNITARPLVFPQSTTPLRFQGYSFAKSAQVGHPHEDALAQVVTSAKQMDSHDHLSLESKDSRVDKAPAALSIDFFKQFFQNLIHPPEAHEHEVTEPASVAEKVKNWAQDAIGWVKEAARYLVEDSRHLLGLNDSHADSSHGHEHGDHHHHTHSSFA